MTVRLLLLAGFALACSGFFHGTVNGLSLLAILCAIAALLVHNRQARRA